MTKKTIVFITTVLVLGCLTVGLFLFKERGSRALPACPNCNVILITFDALRADHLGAYGYKKNTSPRFDELASRSQVFTEAISQCGTTLCSLLSILNSHFPLLDDDSNKTIAEILSNAGYKTIAVVAQDWARARWGMGKGFEVFDESFKSPERAATTTKRVIAAIEKNGTQPFFLWAHYLQPHAPYFPSREVFEEFYSIDHEQPSVFSIPALYTTAYDQNRELYENILTYYTQVKKEVAQNTIMFGKELLMTPSMLAQYRAMYDGNIKEADSALGSLLDYLDNAELSANTIIVIGADHGESLGEHGIFDHNALYQGILHTPLLFHHPNNSHATHSKLVMNVDIVPTILSILNIEHSEEFRGQDLFADSDKQSFQYAGYSIEKVIRKGDYKFIFQEAGLSNSALYNLADDPGETKNLFRSHRAIAEELIDVYKNITKDKNASTEDILERLRAIGYAH